LKVLSGTTIVSPGLMNWLSKPLPPHTFLP
jgi:hypothetical protein